MTINFDNEEIKIKRTSVAGNNTTTEVSSAPLKKQPLWENAKYYTPAAKPETAEPPKKFDPETIKTVQQNIASMLGSDNMEQGTKAVMARYYAKHDPEFSKLSPKEQEKYLNAKLAEFAKLLIPDGATTEDQKKAVFLKTASLYTMAEASKTPIENIKNSGTDGVNAMLKEMESKQLKVLAAKVDPNNPLKSIEDFLKSTLAADPKYSKLSEAEKEEFVKEKANAFIKNTIGFDMKNLSTEGKNNAAKGALAVIQNLVKEGKGISDFMAMSPLQQSKLINNTLRANNELMKDESFKRFVDQQEARINLMNDAIASGIKEEDLTERDLYNQLKKIDVKNMTPEQKTLYYTYKSYDNMSPKDRERLFNDKPNIKSNTAQRLLTNANNIEFLKNHLPSEYQNKEALLNNKEARDAYAELLKSEDSAKAIEEYNNYLRTLGFTREEIKEFNQKIYAENPQLITRQANFKMFDVDKTPENQAKWDNIAANSCSEDMISLFRPLVQITAENYNQDETVKYYEAQENTTFYHDISIAVNEKPKEFGLEVEQKLAASNILTDEKKTVATKELIVTADASRQEYYAQEFSKINNKAVTEGLIQAEPYVKPEARENYSKHVTNAINNNGYDAQTKAQLNQTRQEVQNNSSTNTQTTSQTSTQSNTSLKSASNNVNQSQAQSSNFATNTISSNAAATTSQTQIKNVQNIVAEIEKALLEGKRDVVAQNIEAFQQHVAQSQEQRAEKIEQQNKKEIEEQEKKAPEEVVEDFLNEYKESGGISEEVIQNLKAVYSSDGMAGLYEKIGSSGLGAGAQRNFLIQFASKGTFSAIRSFADSYKGNNSIIMLLYEYSNDASLISYLNSDSLMSLLSQGKIKLKDFLRYASPSTVANYVNELHKTGNNEGLKEILGLMNTSRQNDMVARYSLDNDPPGGDKWRESIEQRRNETSALYSPSDGIAMGSNKVPMGRGYDKHKIKGPFYFNA